ncbi:MAG TPA: hypothetical protein VFA48_04140 [Gammaproteobacteria bacterium]|nr:hypothetical protein [Gammaproteobacteria bacterium]
MSAAASSARIRPRLSAAEVRALRELVPDADSDSARIRALIRRRVSADYLERRLVQRVYSALLPALRAVMADELDRMVAQLREAMATELRAQLGMGGHVGEAWTLHRALAAISRDLAAHHDTMTREHEEKKS